MQQKYILYLVISVYSCDGESLWVRVRFKDGSKSIL